MDDGFRKNLYKHLDNGGPESLVRDFLLKKMIEKSIPFPSEKPDDPFPKKDLTSYKEFSDPLKVARQIIGYIKDGPYDYIACVPAFIESEKNFGANVEIKISDRLSIVDGSMIPSEFQLSSGIAKMDSYVYRLRGQDAGSIKFNTDRLYFIYRTSGYLTDWSRPSCLNDMYDDIRAFYGASIVFGIVSYLSFIRQNKLVYVVTNSFVDNVFTLQSV